jgi:ABC-type branched-subunit amino acid transport system substrate-binding protein
MNKPAWVQTAVSVFVCGGLALWTAALPIAQSGSNQGVSDLEILIGIEGDTSSFASDEENLGMRMLMQSVNEGGGVHGRKLVGKSYPRSGGAASDEAIANVKRLVEQDHVFLVFNHGGPASTGIAPYAMSQRVPYMFPHTALLTNDADRYVFTSYPRYLGESQIMFRYLAETRRFTRIGIVHDENVYGRFFLDRLREYSPKFGYEMVGAQALGDRRPADLTSALAALKPSNPDAIVLALYPEQAKKVMEAKAKLDWKNVRMVSVGPLTDEQYLNVPGGFAEGSLGFCYYPDPNVGDEPGVREYRRLMARYYPGRALNRYSLYGYVFGRLVVEGLTRAGRDLTRERFVDAMESISNWTSGGIMPPVTFSAANHHAQRAGFICELKDARFQAIGGWVEK